MDIAQERLTVLTSAAEHRQREVLHHQINIDNYNKAIAVIDADYADDDAMQKFKAQLESLLASSLVEQTKETIMLRVIKQQLE